SAFSAHRRPRSPPPFPYTTLFRSLPPILVIGQGNAAVLVGRDVAGRGLLGPVEDALQRALLETDAGLPQGLTKRCHAGVPQVVGDRKSTRLNSSHGSISYAVFCLT